MAKLSRIFVVSLFVLSGRWRFARGGDGDGEGAELKEQSLLEDIFLEIQVTFGRS